MIKNKDTNKKRNQMPRLIFLSLIFGLAGCESDFQKCMDTELPRSIEMLKIDEARKQLLDLEELKRSLEEEAPFDRELSQWYEANPWPKRPDGMTSAAFWETEIFLAYKVNENLAIKKIYGIRADIKNGGYLNEYWADMAEKSAIALRPRAINNDCWGRNNCDYPITAEMESIGEGADYIEVALNGLDEAMVTLAKEIYKISEESLILATVRCNSKGLYE